MQDVRCKISKDCVCRLSPAKLHDSPGASSLATVAQTDRLLYHPTAAMSTEKRDGSPRRLLPFPWTRWVQVQLLDHARPVAERRRRSSRSNSWIGSPSGSHVKSVKRNGVCARYVAIWSKGGILQTRGAADVPPDCSNAAALGAILQKAQKRRIRERGDGVRSDKLAMPEMVKPIKAEQAEQQTDGGQAICRGCG
ncbi:hypothetical protein VTK56DRAFT_322 [Thermocarpiscus australiensis]